MDSSSFRLHNQPAATEIRFFKIILRKTLEDGNLKIPNNFTTKIPNPVYLKPPDGTEWKVHWNKHDEGVFFGNGWKEFALYYLLDHGHLLLFEYKETSHFEVHIFGLSGLEIDYPDYNSVEILNEPLPCKVQKKKLESPLSSPSTGKKLRPAARTGPILEGNESEEAQLEMPAIGAANKGLCGKSKRRNSSFPSTSEALKEAKEFKLTNPSCIVNIKRSNLLSSPLPFPTVFFREQFKQNRQDVKMQFGGNLWPARLIYYPLKDSVYISAGWFRFAKASNLQAGDVCIFELVNREDLVFNVHVLRAND